MCGWQKEKINVSWKPPPATLKFNVDEAAKRKPRLMGIGGVLQSATKTLIVFSVLMGEKSNKAKEWKLQRSKDFKSYWVVQSLRSLLMLLVGLPTEVNDHKGYILL